MAREKMKYFYSEARCTSCEPKYFGRNGKFRKFHCKNGKESGDDGCNQDKSLIFAEKTGGTMEIIIKDIPDGIAGQGKAEARMGNFPKLITFANDKSIWQNVEIFGRTCKFSKFPQHLPPNV